jgi:REP element-mobilizing transposase RayT
LHGEQRGSVDRHRYHRYGTPDMPPNEKLLSDERAELKTKAVSLNKRQRAVVDATIREICEHRNYSLYALNVRTNHIHVVVNSSHKPEIIMSTFKAYATRRLREANLIHATLKPWSRHGSTRYLWTEEQVSEAVEYVMFGQGDKPFH